MDSTSRFRFGYFLAINILVISIVQSIYHKQADAFVVSEVEKIFFKLFPDAVKGSPDEKLTPIDWWMQDVFPRLIGQRSNNENGTKWQFKEYAYTDTSNDDASRLTGQALITRSGFKFETYDAIADDGYITILTRIINPLADQKQLRQPPILMEHGGTIDPTAYLIASSIQHHPEKWPRSYSFDGPITSWNRSLAFVLANNGFDVWLAETRGANEKNTRHIKGRAAFTSAKGVNDEKNMTLLETVDQLMRQWTYYAFAMDDIIAHEIKSHIDLVLMKTGAPKVHLFSFSLSTPTTLGFLSIRPDYAKKVEGYVSMAPIISGQGSNRILKLVLHTICPMLPDRIGGIHITDIVLTQPFRELLVILAKSRHLRYGILKAIISLLLGSSPKYNTHLDLNVLGHMLRHLSFRLAKQFCQQVSTDRFQKYDYGPVKNKILYKSEIPPEYDISNLKLGEWMIVAAANDQLSTPQVVDHLVEIVNPKPVARIDVPGYNHLDLIAGFENDKYVNLPILKYYQEMSKKYELGFDEDLETAGARNLNFKALFSSLNSTGKFDFTPEKLTESATNLGKSLTNITSSLFANNDTLSILKPLQKSLFDLLQNLGSNALGGQTKTVVGEQNTNKIQ